MNSTVFEQIVPLIADPHIFIGKKPVAVLFGEERVKAKSWREVFTVILTRCNQDVRHHQMLMYLRGKVAGKRRVFLSNSVCEMHRPVRIDEDMYAETHYGAETLMHILTKRILEPVQYDCSDISIVLGLPR